MNDAYVEGFVKQCEAVGVDPEALLKLSQESDPLAATKLLSGAGGIAGGSAGASLGGLLAGTYNDALSGGKSILNMSPMGRDRLARLVRGGAKPLTGKGKILAMLAAGLATGTLGAGIGAAGGGLIDAGRAVAKKSK